LPDTIATRAVIVHMRRRSPEERVEPFRFRRHEPIGRELAGRLVPWVLSVIAELDGVEPDMPPGIVDRAADVWEPLLAIADAAGGDWPERGRKACLALTGELREVEPSLGVRLLGDLLSVWEGLGDPDSAHTEQLLEELHRIDEAPWADLRGRPLDPRGLARLLRRYGIASTSVRVGDRAAKGYRRADLHDAWSRYLSSSLPDQGHRGHDGHAQGDHGPQAAPLVTLVTPPKLGEEDGDLDLFGEVISDGEKSPRFRMLSHAIPTGRPTLSHAEEV